MPRYRIYLSLFGLVLVPSIAAANGDLPQQAYEVLKAHCLQCHGVNDEAGNGFRVDDYALLTRPSGGKKPAYVTPGKPESSLIWIKAVKEKSMPPDYADTQPDDAERNILDQWIRAGAGFPRATDREAILQPEPYVLDAIRNDLRKLPSAQRPFQRYFVLTHLYNNATVTADKLALYRAAVAKLMNSLSWKPIAVPQPIDKQETILRIDLRDYDWD